MVLRWLLAAMITVTPLTKPDAVRAREWYLAALNVSQAHAIASGQGVLIAVIDTGVDTDHIDLTGNVQPGANLTSAAAGDLNGHGTLMAGLIGGHGHGAAGLSGIEGIAPGAKILPVKTAVLADSEDISVIRGINYAVDHRSQVICLALGGSADSPALRKAILDAEAADIVVVAAAGNRPDATQVEFPAAYPGVIAAAGTDENGNHASVSVTGPEVVLSAPAVNIVSTLNTGGYGIGTGTSSATAIIAGAAALVRSKFPKMSATEVVHRLEATATDKGPPGRDDEYGFGIVNPLAALTADVPPAGASPTPTATASPPMHHSNGWWPYAIAVAAILIGSGLWLGTRRRTR